jgi:hypothetical protein
MVAVVFAESVVAAWAPDATPKEASAAPTAA